MDPEELTARVRALRARGRSPKEIARSLGVPPSARVMDDRDLAAFTRSFFAAYHEPPLPGPLDLAQDLVFGAAAYAPSRRA
jgi:hypothetical protein